MKIVHFAIPVAPKRSEGQWQRVNELLGLTLGSIFNQSDWRFRVHVCAHERPEILSDPRFTGVNFLQADFWLPRDDRGKRRDKRHKRWNMARQIRAEGGGYVMAMDADDLVHRDFVSHILSDDNEVGYVLREGYALDFQNRKLAPIPGAFRKSFSAVCGSSGVVYMLPEDLPETGYGTGDRTSLYERVVNHKYYAEGTGRGGQRFASMPFPAGIYTLNNAVNLSNLLVRTEERQETLIRGIAVRAIPDPATARDAQGLTFAEAFGFAPGFFETIPDPLPIPSVARAADPDNPAKPAREKGARLSDAEVTEQITPHARQLAAVMDYLGKTGWLESARTKRPIDGSGHPIPWYTYPAITFLKTRIPRDASVFEFGSGNSTLWWAARTRSVTAVEHTPAWAEIVSQTLPDNARLNVVALSEDGDYARAARASGETYDFIVVDGRDRVNCARHSIEALTPRGVLIWDNSERKRYIPGFDALIAAGFRRLEFRGLAPIRGKALETSIFYRPGNILGI